MEYASLALSLIPQNISCYDLNHLQQIADRRYARSLGGIVVFSLLSSRTLFGSNSINSFYCIVADQRLLYW